MSARIGFDMGGAFYTHGTLYCIFSSGGYPKSPPQFLPSTQPPLWYPGAV